MGVLLVRIFISSSPTFIWLKVETEKKKYDKDEITVHVGLKIWIPQLGLYMELHVYGNIWWCMHSSCWALCWDRYLVCTYNMLFSAGMSLTFGVEAWENWLGGTGGKTCKSVVGAMPPRKVCNQKTQKCGFQCSSSRDISFKKRQSGLINSEIPKLSL